MTTYFKAVRPNGGSFHDPRFRWATEPGGITTHPAPAVGASFAEHYLSVSTVATDCTGMLWPCRLLQVEAVGETWVPDPAGLPHKVAGSAFRTVRELPAHEAFGPYGVQVVEILERCARLTADDADAFAAVRDAAAARGAAWDAAAARGAAWDAARVAVRDAAAARGAAWGAAWDAAAARGAAWDAVRDATLAWLVKDEITAEQFATLTEAWNAVIGEGGE